MPLKTDIASLALGEIADDLGQCMFLLDPESGEFVAAARCKVVDRYLECINLVSDGFGPTMFLLLMQKARREGLYGVAPDLKKNSDEAKRMDARFYDSALPGVGHRPNPAATHPEVYLNQIYFLAQDLIDESQARGNARRYFVRGRPEEGDPQSRPPKSATAVERTCTAEDLRKRLDAYLFPSEQVHKKRESAP